MKKYFFLVIFGLFFSCKDSQVIENKKDTKDEQSFVFNSKSFDFLPSSTTNSVYKRKQYVFSYSEKHEQSEWVAYFLDSNSFSSRHYERPFFNEDPLVTTHSADWRNYKNSGYDKGHLCPAGDRKSSYEDYKSTFYTSNISPQKHDFNSGIWNTLEEKTRYWASKYGGIYVVTGGVLDTDLKTIGREDVAVPKYFYKILFTKDGSKMIAFLLPHKVSNRPLYEFVTTVDEIEQKTGIDFFPKLEDAVENRLERNDSYKDWSF